MNDQTNKVDYKPIADTPSKSRASCSHFEPKEEGTGTCFGHQVSASGTCNFFEPKQ